MRRRKRLGGEAPLRGRRGLALLRGSRVAILHPMTNPTIEVWLRGPVLGVPAPLQPVAHALLQALEDVSAAAVQLPPGELWRPVGGAASVGFHIRHMASSLDRLFTYARGEPLSDEQRAALKAERAADQTLTVEQLLASLARATDLAIAQLRATDPTSLSQPRAVGRAAHPSTVGGLLFHAGEHAARHAGQVVTTVIILKARRAKDD